MRLSGIGHTIVSLSLLAGIFASQLVNLNDFKASSDKPSINEIERQHEVIALRLQLLSRLPDFGFSNLMSNWIFLNFLQYFGDSAARDVMGYDLSPDFLRSL